MKAEKGITLVALVITIIVLLILAVVSISLVMTSGIDKHAQNAADLYNEAQINEAQQLNAIGNLMTNMQQNQ